MSEIDRNKLIGERVRFYRTAKSMSLEEVAKALPRKLTWQQLALYETGKSRWPADLLCEIENILGVDLRILTGTEKEARARRAKDEWDAEHYKTVLLSLKRKVRGIMYKMIDAVVEMEK